MDAQVIAAMAKWPDVAAVFGWLRLDARGHWWLRDERLSHDGMNAFFQRNYGRDGHGRYYVQNGPQKVYVTLETAPFVARRVSNGWQVLPGETVRPARNAFVTPEGEMLLDIDGTLTLIDDRELAGVIAQVMPQWDGMLSSLPASVVLPEGEIPLQVETLPRLWRQYGIEVDPCD